MRACAYTGAGGRGKPLGARTFSGSRKTVWRKLKLPGRVRTCGRGAGAPLALTSQAVCLPGWADTNASWLPLAVLRWASPPLRQRPQEAEPAWRTGCRSLGIGPFLLLLEGADLISFSESWMLVSRQQGTMCRFCAL